MLKKTNVSAWLLSPWYIDPHNNRFSLPAPVPSPPQPEPLAAALTAELKQLKAAHATVLADNAALRQSAVVVQQLACVAMCALEKDRADLQQHANFLEQQLHGAQQQAHGFLNLALSSKAKLEQQALCQQQQAVYQQQQAVYQRELDSVYAKQSTLAIQELTAARDTAVRRLAKHEATVAAQDCKDVRARNPVRRAIRHACIAMYAKDTSRWVLT